MAKTGDYGIKYIENDDSVDIVTDMNGNFMAVSEELSNLSDEIGDCASVQHGHNLNSSSITGVLPVNKGGTGANNINQAKKNLGIQKYCYLVAVKNKINDCADVYIDCADFVLDCTAGFTYLGLLNSFLASLPAGSKVIFAPGSYYILEPIQVNTRLTLEGLNHRATFFMERNAVMLNIGDGENQANNVTIRNLYFRYWDYRDLPPTEGTKVERSFSAPVICVKNANGVYIEKCGLYKHNSYIGSDNRTALIKYKGYAANCVVEKCVLNTDVHSVKNEDKKSGYAFDLGECAGTNISIKFIANFGTSDIYKPSVISNVETTFIGCTGVHIYDENGEV